MTCTHENAAWVGPTQYVWCPACGALGEAHGNMVVLFLRGGEPINPTFFRPPERDRGPEVSGEGYSRTPKD